MKPYGLLKLFLTRDYLKNNKLYLCVQCLESNCKYSIEFIYEENSIELQTGEQYSYYVYSDNTELTFRINHDDVTSKALHYVWIKGEHIQVKDHHGTKEIPFKF